MQHHLLSASKLTHAQDAEPHRARHLTDAVGVDRTETSGRDHKDEWFVDEAEGSGGNDNMTAFCAVPNGPTQEHAFPVRPIKRRPSSARRSAVTFH